MNVNPEFSNRIICCDCVEGMQALPSDCIPMTLTSPPYDGLRLYGGHQFNFEKIAQELFRVTMPGGVVVWVVQEQIVDGSETGTSSYQRLFFRDIGFRLHQTMVMVKKGTRVPATGLRYGTPLEYAFVLSKSKPRSINLIRDRVNQEAGREKIYLKRTTDGRIIPNGTVRMPLMGYRTAVWEYLSGSHSATERFAFEHPALMQEQMAADHIISWSRPGDLVFDPLAGAGTTCKMALLYGRRYLGMEIVERYCEIARERLRLAHLIVDGNESSVVASVERE